MLLLTNNFFFSVAPRTRLCKHARQSACGLGRLEAPHRPMHVGFATPHAAVCYWVSIAAWLCNRTVGCSTGRGSERHFLSFCYGISGRLWIMFGAAPWLVASDFVTVQSCPQWSLTASSLLRLT